MHRSAGLQTKRFNLIIASCDRHPGYTKQVSGLHSHLILPRRNYDLGFSLENIVYFKRFHYIIIFVPNQQ